MRPVDDEMPDDYPTCPTCGGPGDPLGPLGNLMWFRCRNCGIDFSMEMMEDEQ